MAQQAILSLSEGDEDPTARNSGNSTDEILRDQFETLLRARRLANAGLLGPTAAVLALARASFVISEVINWAARKSNLLCSPAIYELLPPEQRRQLIRDCLRLQLPILQPQARAELDKALAALGIGGTEPLLKQAKTRRRRASPARIIEAEYGVMKWIAWQYGLGRKKKDVEADVASALGCTSALFAKWKAELAKIFGHNHVHDALAEAEQLGRFEAAGGVPSVRESDQESFIRRFTNCTLERDLAVLVSRFREGAQKRRMPQGDAARAAPRDRGRKPPH